MIRDLKRNEVEDEIRKQVDVLMREELDLLKIVSNTVLHRHDLTYIHYCIIVYYSRAYHEIKS